MPTPSRSSSTSPFSRAERIQIGTIYSIIVGATVIGFIASFLVGQSSPLFAGLGFAAYALGLRHGVDADHIAAIDNTTRKLMQEDKRPLTVGTWFSLGHSTVVFAVSVVLVLAARAVASGNSALQSAGNTIGLAVSGAFLVLIGLINVLVVLSIYRAFVDVRRGAGKMDSSELEDILNKRGFFNRAFRSLFRVIRAPWQIYPVGVLFGFGFDTATEIAFLAIVVGGVGLVSSAPLWAILLLPFMFACGMVAVDTTDGIAMRAAYGWAFLHPLRKLYYNLTVTIVSVLVAFGIGGIEILQLVGKQLNLGGPFWNWLGSLDFETIGVWIIALFVLCWGISVAYWKIRRFEARFATP
jgi:nickel/cobalt transporter (NiCoT) family protein